MSIARFVKRKLSRLAFYPCKYGAVLLGYAFGHRAYMRLYIPLLRAFGMNIEGSPRYISATTYFDSMKMITLSERVVISTGVSFLTHDYSLTTAMIAIGDNPPTDIASERPIKIGKNVFIGRSALIMPNTTIGDHCIIGAGSIVRGNIPPYSIVVGNPGVVTGDIREFANKWKSKVDSDQVRAD